MLLSIKSKALKRSKCVFFVESYRRPCVSCSLGRTHIPTALLLVSRCVSKCARIGGFTAVNWSFYGPLLSKLGLFSSRLEIIYGFYREKMLIFPFTEGLKNFLYFPVNIFPLKNIINCPLKILQPPLPNKEK